MKLILLLVAVCGLVNCRPQDFNSNFRLANPIYITSYIYDLLPDQSYFYSYEQNDEQKKFERGFIRQGPTPEEDINTVEGSYSYVGPDGQNYNVTYTADENGFQPSGDHLPPSAGVKPKLGISSAALASLSG
ncbi:cuticle protein CP14.6-like [Harmonia axyridis]|uniref:cuticle protein CP14.6-like n=1 Tax=Harmonia axyridis TaxID=115357 RepID=UPI001E2783FA|nr:cuticle protein CP14.6-like [Harmonia axyridis]XP_045472425.1 cuticle protein CP14.6-like [Harmonia axyridis]